MDPILSYQHCPWIPVWQGVFREIPGIFRGEANHFSLQLTSMQVLDKLPATLSAVAASSKSRSQASYQRSKLQYQAPHTPTKGPHKSQFLNAWSLFENSPHLIGISTLRRFLPIVTTCVCQPAEILTDMRMSIHRHMSAVDSFKQASPHLIVANLVNTLASLTENCLYHVCIIKQSVEVSNGTEFRKQWY
eukprot:1158376-Pelagomonas_calceolata.AAC.16